MNRKMVSVFLSVVLLFGLLAISSSPTTTFAASLQRKQTQKRKKGQRYVIHRKSGSVQKAICRDGSITYSRNRRGTCSRHGGVRRWLR